MSNWSSDWQSAPTPPQNPWDALSQDELLTMHMGMKDSLAKLKEEELKLRKYIVDRAFPQKTEGMNTLDLGLGCSLKAGVKFNYNLRDEKLVCDGLEAISKIGNTGPFIADKLISWTPNFLLTEYRALTSSAEHGSEEAKAILKIVDTFLEITDGAPTLEVKKGKK